MAINFKKQIQQNLLAILSVLIALSALGYNSWRNELSEENRNYRAAGFEIMRVSAHLQYQIDAATYALDKKRVDPIDGWVRVNVLISLSQLMTPQIEQAANDLKKIWKENYSSLMTDENANKKVSKANEKLIEAVKDHIESLH